MRDTPFTDSCTYGFTDEDGIHCEAVHADIARTLERELDRYKSDVEIVTKERDEALNKAHNYEQGYLTHAARADTLEKERDEAREDAKLATHDAAQETIKVSTTKSHWIEACRERDEAREPLRKLSQLVHRLFALLETVEVSDSEREFHPTVIRSCRVAHTSELAELLPALKEASRNG